MSCSSFPSNSYPPTTPLTTLFKQNPSCIVEKSAEVISISSPALTKQADIRGGVEKIGTDEQTTTLPTPDDAQNQELSTNTAAEKNKI